MARSGRGEGPIDLVLATHAASDTRPVSPEHPVSQDVLVLVCGRLVMAVAFLSTPASMTAEQYDRVIKQLDASGAGEPPGRRFHACVGQGDHLMMFDVWDSVEEFEAFGGTLLPILAKERIELAPAEPLQVHRVIEGGEAGFLRKTIAELREKAFFIRPVEKLREKIHSARERSSEGNTPSGSAMK